MDFSPPPVDLQGAPAESAERTLRARARNSDRDGVREAAEQFEAVFLSQMLSPMFETVETDPLFGGGPGERMYKSLMVEEYGKAIARAGGVGIADHVEREILRLQEAQK